MNEERDYAAWLDDQAELAACILNAACSASKISITRGGALLADFRDATEDLKKKYRDQREVEELTVTAWEMYLECGDSDRQKEAAAAARVLDRRRSTMNCDFWNARSRWMKLKDEIFVYDVGGRRSNEQKEQ